MPGSYSHTTRADGLTLTAAIYNADHENHISNAIPTAHDDYSATQGQMRSQTDPGESGAESQATSLAGELERLRYAIAEAKGETYWYETAPADLNVLDERTRRLRRDDSLLLGRSQALHTLVHTDVQDQIDLIQWGITT